eukprot:15440219-Alexandrium_andersonii.AAC.1
MHERIHACTRTHARTHANTRLSSRSNDCPTERASAKSVARASRCATVSAVRSRTAVCRASLSESPATLELSTAMGSS